MASMRLRHLRAAEKALARANDQLVAAADACIGMTTNIDGCPTPQRPEDSDGWHEIQGIREYLEGSMSFSPVSELTALIERLERTDG